MDKKALDWLREGPAWLKYAVERQLLNLQSDVSPVLKDSAIQIGIGLNFLDVHINRSPLNGKISLLKKIPGKFKSLKKISSLLENERAIAIIEGKDIKIGLVLIASRLVRRISTFLSEGDTIQIGQKVGMIRFGSQVDLLIPGVRSLKITTRPGERVKAGISILASY